jgi:hypothetical protein
VTPRNVATYGQSWLKANGSADKPLPNAWLETREGPRLQRTGFPRRPRITPGDRLVYYAPIWQCIFAVVEAVAEPREHPLGPGGRSRWPWFVEVEPLLLIPRLDAAPPVQAAGVLPRSMSQQSHIRLSPDHYRRAVEAIASVAL